jgi:transglutaminase-like putative cysteine protease
MERRRFFQLAATGVAALALPGRAAFAGKAWKAAKAAKPPKAKPSTPWKTFEVTTKVRVEGSAAGQVWLPVPVAKTSYQEHTDTLWNGNFSRAGLLTEAAYGAPIFFAEWEKGGSAELETTFRVKLRDRSGPEPASAEEAAPYLAPSRHVPRDGIVELTAQRVAGRERNPDRKARLVYEWIVENTARDAKVRGCGQGDVKSLLESGRLLGKCADLSSLYVALCRASGVPAREMFGLRVAPSRLSPSIGKAGGDVSGAQHCRAEYYSAAEGGWVPVDPADVRKVILEENKRLESADVSALREKFFGFWEMNWVAFNSARDFRLPPAPGELVNYLMYPYYAAGSVTKDGMDAKDFRYSISAREA